MKDSLISRLLLTRNLPIVNISFMARTALLMLLMTPFLNVRATTRYVKPVAAGSANGSSWSNASASLQAMINASVPGDEVWVAAGVYLPTEDQSGNTNPADPRTKTFHLPEGIKVYGGFAGTEASVAARNLTANTTTLSGDLGIAANASDNAYHVVAIVLPSYSSQGCTLDGLSIRYGNATGGTGQDHGGGIRLYKGTGHVLRQLYIATNNAVDKGGGIYAEETDLTLLRDTVAGNSSGFGGGLHAYGTAATIDSSAIFSNVSNTGGGIAVFSGTATISRCSVYGNTANSSVGGGIYISSSGSSYCTGNAIYNNAANSYWGGGLYFEGGNFGVLNAWNNSFYGNSAQKGAGIYHNDGAANYSNNTLFNNAASNEGGGLSKLGGTLSLRNNIFWGNKKNNNSATSGSDIVIGGLSANTFYNNLFQLPATGYNLGSGASGNIFGTNPLFIDANQPFGADGLPRTSDDGLALSPCSPAINAGITLSPAVPADILLNGRVGNYDIGAYEFQGALPVLAGAITGDSTVCLGSSIPLSNTVAGGTWSSANTAVATVSPTGVVSGLALGTTVISYTVGTTGCPGTVATRTITVGTFVTLGPIAGADTVCTTQTIQLSNATSGGAWSSSNTTVATVNSAGIVTGIAGGTAVISYTTGGTGCANAVAKTVTVVASPVVGAITGDLWVCMYGTPVYTTATPGGVWSTASNGSKSTIAQNGALTPVTTGTDTVLYTVTNAAGCQTQVKKQIIIVTMPAFFNNLSGPGTVCANKTVQWSNALFGGVWTSSNTSVATVSAQGAITGIAGGTATISYTYTNPSYGCTSTTTRSITVLPAAAAGPITGASTVCMNGSLQLGSAASGGVWSTMSGGLRSTVSASGLVSPVAAGTIDTVRYIVANSNGCADTAYKVINIGASPVVAAILGGDSLCANASALFTSATAGGAWSSANTAIATVSAGGSVTGLSQGLATVTYTVTSTLGCATSVSKNVYVKAAPVVSAITGPATICISSTGQYSNSTPGGQWSTASNGAIGSIGAAGLLSANTPGTDTVRYTVSNGAGCVSVAEWPVTINAPQVVTIAGADSLCAGTSVQLTHPVAGGTWTQLAGALGAVSGNGLYTAANAAGIDTVYYQYASNGCPAGVKKPMTIVVQDSAAITGSATLCKGEAGLLAASLSGGAWTSDNSAVATVNGNGQLAGVSAGTAAIHYVIINALGCSAVSTRFITVHAPIVTTSQNGAVLTATGSQSGATYQWIDCGKNNQPIAGATNPVYTATANGQYAVIVTYSGCKDTSACLNVTGLGAATVAGGSPVTIEYMDNALLKVSTGAKVPVSIRLFDIQGKLVRELLPGTAASQIDVSDLARGMYLLHVYFRDQKLAVKVDIH